MILGVLVCGLIIAQTSAFAAPLKKDAFITPKVGIYLGGFGGFIGGELPGEKDWAIGNCVPNDTPTDDMVFSTQDETGWHERMRITKEGNVGIGTTAPEAKLDVVGRIKSTMARAQWSTFGDWSTTSTTWVDTDAVVTVTTTGGPLLLFWTTQVCNDTSAARTGFRFTIDGTAVTSAPLGNAMHQTEVFTTTYQNELSMTWLSTDVAAGSHTIRVQIKVSNGIGYIGEASITEGTERTLIVVEL